MLYILAILRLSLLYTYNVFCAIFYLFYSYAPFYWPHSAKEHSPIPFLKKIFALLNVFTIATHAPVNLPVFALMPSFGLTEHGTLLFVPVCVFHFLFFNFSN